jgi:DNA-binding NarL/FixJ family response regulator
MTQTLPTQITVAVLEDDEATLRRFRQAIDHADGLALLATFSLGADALKWLEHNAPDVLLTDLGLPDVPGLSVIAYCAKRHPCTDILVISMYEDEQSVISSLEAGASGYLLKDSGEAEIGEKVRELRAGGAPMSPVIARLVLKRLRPSQTAPEPTVDDLWVRPTERELLILTRIAQGFSYTEIANLEGISRHTVHTHIKNIYSKLEVHSRSEAVFEASRMGLIPTPGAVQQR